MNSFKSNNNNTSYLSSTSQKLSIIIVNWNTCDLLRTCLQSIYHFCDDLNIEVLVSDNNSSDKSTEMVKKEFPQVILIENQENIGFGCANNCALFHASGDYILFLNPDTQFIDRSLHKTLHFYTQKPNAGFVGCRLLNPDRTLQPGSFQFPSLFMHLIVNLGLYVFLPASQRRKAAFLTPDYDKTRSVDWMRGAFLLIDKQKLQLIGAFDEKIYMYGEDLDICLRAKAAGLINYYFADTQIIHHGNQAGQIRFGDQRLRTIYRSFDYVAKKHKDERFTARYEFITFFTSVLKVLRCKLRFLYLSSSKQEAMKTRGSLHQEIAKINWELWQQNRRK